MWKVARRVMLAGCISVFGLSRAAWAGFAGLTPVFAQAAEKETRNYTMQSLVVLVLTGLALLVVCKPSRRQL